MIDQSLVMGLLEKKAARNEQRRHFFRKTGGVAAGVAFGTLLGACGSGDDADAADGPTDPEILNFALNLEYLESQFYQVAVFGTRLPANLQTGVGTQGAVTGGSKVPFTDPVVAAYAKEIAVDETAHVAFLRSALGSSAIAQPAINIDGTDPNGSFSVAARAAGIIGPGEVFNPYADDVSFLLGAYIFEDVGVTAYKGASPLISSKTFLEAAAGILAVEAYHAGLIRTVLYSKGVATPAIYTNAQKISDLRDGADGTVAKTRADGTVDAADRDQGLLGDDATISNIVPTDANGLAFSRSPGDVLNIVFLTKNAVTQGGFFPAGVNGSLMMSSAN